MLKLQSQQAHKIMTDKNEKKKERKEKKRSTLDEVV